MTNRGLRRGLATSAITALAITGLPLFAGSAEAQPLSSYEAASDVNLASPENGQIVSVVNDGTNQTIHLVANGGTNVQSVQFEYENPSGTWNNIATVNRVNGAFSAEWAPPTALYNTTVNVRATALSAANTPIDSQTNAIDVSATGPAVNISDASGANIGVFQEPYGDAEQPAGWTTTVVNEFGTLRGVTTDVSGSPSVSLFPEYDCASTSADWFADTSAGDTTRAFSGPLDVTGYNWGTADDVDQQIAQAEENQDEDAEPVRLYKQTITNVSVSSSKSTVQSGGNVDITVTVTDQNGNPVYGAQVARDDNTDNAADGDFIYTDSRGKATFNSGAISSNKTFTVYVNTTDTDAYENGVDFKRSASVTSYTPTATTVAADSADGSAFDRDEYTAGDISVTVKDQNGDTLDGETVAYSWTIVPFDGSPTTTTTESTATTGPNGKATIALPGGTGAVEGTYTLNYYINRDGTPGEGAGDLSGTDLTIKTGEANVVWDDGSVAQAQSGSTETFTGSLELDDETPLPNRNLVIDWTKNAGDVDSNAIVAAQGAQPAGTTRVSDSQATSKTDGSGNFGVALTDPATPNQNELNGTLTATTANTPAYGSNTDNSADLEVDFLKNPNPSSPADIDVTAQNLIDGMATPGRPVDLDITVENSDGDLLTDYPVTVSVNHGFLSPNAETAGALTADPAEAEGGLYGEWKPLGTSQNLTTEDDGTTGIVAAIERDELFDTQQTVPTTVTVTAGGVSKTVTIDFTSEDPLNGSSLVVAQSDTQTVTVLPKAPTTEGVAYDVHVKDQFGNLVDGEDVVITDDLDNAYINGTEDNKTVSSNLMDEASSFTLTSDVAGNQTPTGTWTTEKNTWTDGNTVTPGFQATRSTDADGTELTDAGETVNWYVVNYATSTYTLANDANNNAPAGKTVIVTYKAVDQNGEPIEGLTVKFYRTGPDLQQDGQADGSGTTNSNGIVRYVFTGTQEGTAKVEAIAFDAGQPIPESRANNTITFGAVTTGKQTINARLIGYNTPRKRNDILTVNGPNAAKGATIRLYVWRNGHRRLAATKIANRYGNATFVIRDINGRRFTKYRGYMGASALTKPDWTNYRTIR